MYFETTYTNTGNLKNIMFFLYGITESPVILPKNKIQKKLLATSMRIKNCQQWILYFTVSLLGKQTQSWSTNVAHLRESWSRPFIIFVYFWACVFLSFLYADSLSDNRYNPCRQSVDENLKYSFPNYHEKCQVKDYILKRVENALGKAYSLTKWGVNRYWSSVAIPADDNGAN